MGRAPVDRMGCSTDVDRVWPWEDGAGLADIGGGALSMADRDRGPPMGPKARGPNPMGMPRVPMPLPAGPSGAPCARPKPGGAGWAWGTGPSPPQPEAPSGARAWAVGRPAHTCRSHTRTHTQTHMRVGVRLDAERGGLQEGGGVQPPSALAYIREGPSHGAGPGLSLSSRDRLHGGRLVMGAHIPELACTRARGDNKNEDERAECPAGSPVPSPRPQ